MNLGKILVPEEILAKTDRLTEREIRLIRDSIQNSANLIENIEFDGPVVETLRQLQEHYDGSGVPKGLKDDEIIKSARIVAVANAFVAMVSHRSFRVAAGFDEAIDRLLKQSGTIFDRGVVAALINYLDNRGGRLAWIDFSRPPPEGAPPEGAPPEGAPPEGGGITSDDAPATEASPPASEESAGEESEALEPGIPPGVVPPGVTLGVISSEDEGPS